MGNYRSMYKYELADAAGVSMSTFRRWIKSDIEVLAKFGCKKKRKILPPGAVQFLCEKYVITLHKEEHNKINKKSY